MKIARAYSRKQGHACLKEHNCDFLPLIFPNLGNLECYTPLATSVLGVFSRE